MKRNETGPNENFKNESFIQAGGRLDYRIGRSVYSSEMLSHKNSKVEMILTLDLIDEIQENKEENIFMNQFNEKHTNLYAIKECNLGLGVSQSAGFLYLPNIDFSIDFQQCLYTTDTEGINWLKKAFNFLKSQSKLFVP